MPFTRSTREWCTSSDEWHHGGHVVPSAIALLGREVFERTARRCYEPRAAKPGRLPARATTGEEWAGSPAVLKTRTKSNRRALACSSVFAGAVSRERKRGR
jgi:hypothetical protein